MIITCCTPHTLASAEASSVISFTQEEVRGGSAAHKLLIKLNSDCFPPLRLHTKNPLITPNSIWKLVIDAHVRFTMRERGEGRD